MEEKTISYETALLAKLKGCEIFTLTDEWCFTDEHGDQYHCHYKPINCGHEYTRYVDCTQSLLKKWIREEHGIFVELDIGNYGIFPKIMRFKGDNLDYDILGEERFGWTQYEQALEVGLQEALNSIT